MDLRPYIEHTNLRPTLNINDIDKLVEEAALSGLLGVCVPPFWVKRARREIGSQKMILITVAGFPFGYSMTETKLDEIQRAIDNGADEIDVVWNIGSFKSSLPWTKIEIAKCSSLVHHQNKLLKVIVETAYLSELELQVACKMCADAGVDFVKTSTGFASAGASVEHIIIMKKALPVDVGIKASGGIKSYEQATALIEAGATRIGTSAGNSILTPTITQT
jgi:deoxyribose-phosphate aldolase